MINRQGFLETFLSLRAIYCCSELLLFRPVSKMARRNNNRAARCRHRPGFFNKGGPHLKSTPAKQGKRSLRKCALSFSIYGKGKGVKNRLRKYDIPLINKRLYDSRNYAILIFRFYSFDKMYRIRYTIQVGKNL